jgi:iron-sulfur cluster insertion protein
MLEHEKENLSKESVARSQDLLKQQGQGSLEKSKDFDHLSLENSLILTKAAIKHILYLQNQSPKVQTSSSDASLDSGLSPDKIRPLSGDLDGSLGGDISQEKSAKDSLEAATSPKQYLKLCVESGGCAGMQYIFSLESRVKDEIPLEQEGAVLLIDALSMTFLKGVEIHYVEEMIGSHFQVKNPNAVSACSCGVSFSMF